MTDVADVAVVGGGVIGITIAVAAADRGMSVVLLDPDLGRGATRAAAGILSPTDPAEWEEPLGSFNRAALDMWRGWASDLERRSGLPSGLEWMPEIRVGASYDEPFLAASENAAAEVRRVTADEAAALLPNANLAGLCALLLSDTAAVQTDLLVRALQARCAGANVAVVNTRVDGLGQRGNVVALRLDSGEAVLAGQVVIATGAAGSAAISGLPPLPLRPIAGEGVIIRHPVPSRLAMLRTPQGSIVPRSDGTWWVGTSVRDAGFARHPEVDAVQRILTNATTYMPTLRAGAILEVRVGLRPVTLDGLPLLGPVDRNVILATGNGREGIIHAPLCAHIVGLGLERGDWSAVPTAFRADRAAALIGKGGLGAVADGGRA